MQKDPADFDCLISIVRRRLGSAQAQRSGAGALVLCDGTSVHVRPDPEGARVAFWVELEKPPHCSYPVIEAFALDRNFALYLEHGCAIGVDRGADLIVLGRSVDRAILREDASCAFVQDLIHLSQREALEMKRVSPDFAGGSIEHIP